MLRVSWPTNWKYAENLRKHKVRFEAAQFVFYDEDALDMGERMIHGELRQHLLGNAGDDTILFVAYTYEVSGDDEHAHMISARKADPNERRFYWKMYAQNRKKGSW